MERDERRIHWEYINSVYVSGDSGKKRLDELGKDGWELVAVDNHYGYFKRQYLPPQPKDIGNMIYE